MISQKRLGGAVSEEGFRSLVKDIVLSPLLATLFTSEVCGSTVLKISPKYCPQYVIRSTNGDGRKLQSTRNISQCNLDVGLNSNSTGGCDPTLRIPCMRAVRAINYLKFADPTCEGPIDKAHPSSAYTIP